MFSASNLTSTASTNPPIPPAAAEAAPSLSPPPEHPIEALSAINELEATKDYLKKICSVHYSAPASVPSPPGNDLNLQMHCYLAAEVIMKAFRTQMCVLDRDIYQYHAASKHVTERTGAEAPPKSDGVSKLLSGPGHIVDRSGRIVYIHLPGVLRPELLSVVEAACRSLLTAPNAKPEMKRAASNWRVNESYFQPVGRAGFTPGVLTLSPCWFMQAHPPPKYKPFVAAAIRRPDGSDGGLPFIKAVRQAFCIMGALLYLIHPSQYEVGVELWKKLVETNCAGVEDGFESHMMKVIACWASPFTVMQVISNRETPFHFDTSGHPFWYDCLLTVGPYRGGRFELKDVGHRFRYERGTMVFLLSHILQHGASPVEGERVCLASFMRPQVLQWGLSYRALTEDPEPLAAIEARLNIPHGLRVGV